MIGKWCDLMLRRAARRWPGDMSGEMLAEWRAEVQAMSGRWSRLWFALSLATARPHRATALMPVNVLANRPRFGSMLAMVLTPLVASAFVYSVGRIVLWASYNLGSEAMATVALVVFVASGMAVMAWWGARRGRSAAMRGPLAVAILAGSVALAALAVPGLAVGRDAVRMDLPAVVVWIPLLALALSIAAWLSKTGRSGWAWVVGTGAAVLFADLAIVAQVYSILPASSVSWHEAAAGLFHQLIGWNFSIELQILPDGSRTFYSFGSELGPVMLLCSAFALAFAIEAARTRRITQT